MVTSLKEFNNLIDEEMIKKIEKPKLELILKMLNDMNGKSAEEKLQILFTYGMEIKTKGLSFTLEESSLLVNILKASLSPSEKEKLNRIINVLDSMSMS